jgi:hypothetical protein
MYLSRGGLLVDPDWLEKEFGHGFSFIKKNIRKEKSQLSENQRKAFEPYYDMLDIVSYTASQLNDPNNPPEWYKRERERRDSLSAQLAKVVEIPSTIGLPKFPRFRRDAEETKLEDVLKQESPSAWAGLMSASLSDQDFELAKQIAFAHSVKIGRNYYLPLKPLTESKADLSTVAMIDLGPTGRTADNTLRGLANEGWLRFAAPSAQQDIEGLKTKSRWFHVHLSGVDHYSLRQSTPPN